MDISQELSIALQGCSGGIEEHERVINWWVVRSGNLLSQEKRSFAMQDAFGMSFEADEALNKVHLMMFGKIIHE